MSKRRRPGPDNPAQWIDQPYVPEDPSYYLGMGRGFFRWLPFPWVPFKRPRGGATQGQQRKRQRSGQNATVALAGLPAVSKKSKRPAPMQAMPLIRYPWKAHEAYYDPTERHSRLGLALIRIAAAYPKSSCLGSVLLGSALAVGWVWLTVVTFTQAGGSANLWLLLALGLLCGPVVLGGVLLLRGPISTWSKIKPRRTRWFTRRVRRG